jgi:hypothetical protein
MLTIPLLAVPAQLLTVSLNNQTCQINIYQKVSGLYVDLYVNNALIIGGVLAENLNRIVRSAYLGFVGDLAFVDNEAGDSDPVFFDLGTRYTLGYFFPDELP